MARPDGEELTAGQGARLPAGVVTYCLTDIEGSTRQWNDAPHAMGAAVARHQAIIADAVATHRGVTVDAQGEGDSTLSAFDRPGDALAAALEIHAALAAEPWPEVAITVRIGVHTGEAEIRAGTYYGIAVNHAGRLRSLARGGQTVVSRVSAALAGTSIPPGHFLHDAGRYDLKGFPEPEQVYLLVRDADGPVRLAVPRAATTAGRIPAPLTSFVGREAALRSVTTAVAEHRLVTIAGPGGAGKTRLSLEVARASQSAGTPVVLVDLAPVASHDLVVQTIALAAGMSNAGVASPEQVVEHLANHGGLIVLDNCEHLVAPVARFVQAALAAPGTARFLVTSQVSLGIAGERLHALGALPGEDAVRLFCTRASGHDPEFDEMADRDTIADICDRLDGLPLAIELAAAHVRLLTPAQIRQRLTTDVLGLRAAPARDLADRQRTLLAAIDWSVGLLTDHERTLLGRLAVFQGGFTLSAAEAVCSDDRMPQTAVLEVLAALVDRSLVLRRRRGRESRFWLLQTVRTYAWERLGPLVVGAAASSDDAPTVLRREGEIWALVQPGRTTRFRNSKGIRYLALLIGRPGAEFHALDLAGGPAGEGIEMIDEAGRRAYRQRIRDLEHEVDDAAAANDDERRVRAELEIEAVTAELSRRLGLDGRPRREGGAAERARVSVTKAIRNAMARIGAVAPDVGSHLARSITTGTYCCYDPGSMPPIVVESGPPSTA